VISLTIPQSIASVLVLAAIIVAIVSMVVIVKPLPIVSTYGQLNNYHSIVGVNNLNHDIQRQAGCTTGWYVTGYFTPKEIDYSGATKKVFIHGVGTRIFHTSFLKDVRTEGAGQTAFGWYIANLERGWTKIPYPQDSFDGELKAGVSIATDPSVIPTGTSGITISTLPSPWNTYQYKAVDTGPGIDGKHIDVYTGMGQMAKNITLRITGYNNTSCY
jgi:3D (Asp-Asp-Asp) domain-containing protein